MNKTAEPVALPDQASPNIDHYPVVVALVPFVLAWIAVIVAAVGHFVTGWSRNVGCVMFGIAGTVLIFDGPVCLWVFIDWIRFGQPPPLHLSPLIPCREEREIRRRLRNRPKLDDDQFYQAYFAAREIPREVPLRLRQIMEEVTGYDMGGVHPEDNLVWIDLEVDFADVFYHVERDLAVVIRPDQLTTIEDCRFGRLVELIAKEYSSQRREVSTWNLCRKP
jgi:hypothetical protein